ncbi:12919_t:CDS:2 [Cetraspora pellucida]|uniref:12919_t:CDS:1 n=1 Tax=Cetraspora pellucida TaxID=1433469 RepID=A0A9N9NW89_9GLOM|nr:12919_t:CDS:2 [Cetraspora pellucida]
MSYEWQAPKEGEVRSPCPALNAMANHGYLPRDGKGITPKQLFEALQKTFNEDTLLAMFQVAGCFTLYGKWFAGKISLEDLHKHGNLEHDVSLCHVDSALGENWVVKKDLVDQLIANAIDGKIKSESLINTFRARYLDSKKNNPDFTFGRFQVQLASGEYSLFLNIIGANTNKEVDTRIAEMFFHEERLADEWTRPDSSVSLPTILGTNNEISKIMNEEIKKLTS